MPKLLREAALNGLFGFGIMFGLTLLAGGWQWKKPPLVENSPELKDTDRQEVPQDAGTEQATD